MAESKLKPTDAPKPKDSLFNEFLIEKNKFAKVLLESIIAKLNEEQKPEVAIVSIYLQSFQEAVRNAGLIIKKHYDESDKESKQLIDNHVNNATVIPLLNSTNTLLRKKGRLGFLDKIIPILEVIKKILTQITELFPKFLSKLLKKILIPILELIDNLFQIISDTSNIDIGFLKQAEKNFLEMHPLWRQLQVAS